MAGHFSIDLSFVKLYILIVIYFYEIADVQKDLSQAMNNPGYRI